MSEQMTYEQQAQRIAKLERKLAHMTEKEAQQAARVAELEEYIDTLTKSNMALTFDSGDYKVLLDRITELEAQLRDRANHPMEAVYIYQGLSEV